MLFFDKLVGRDNMHAEKNELTTSLQKTLPQEMSEIEKAIAENASQLSKYKRIPLSEVATVGGVFAELSPALRTVAQTITMDGFGYMPINNIGGEALKQFAKSTPGIYAGSFRNAETGKAIMAQLVKLGPQSVTVSTVMPINPIMMAMAVMMVQVNQKLDAIQRIQQQILSYLQEDKKAKLQGNLNMLIDILDKYKQ